MTSHIADFPIGKWDFTQKIKVVHESIHGPPGRKEVKMKRLI